MLVYGYESFAKKIDLELIEISLNGGNNFLPRVINIKIQSI